MHILAQEVGAFAAQCYLVWSDPQKALIIDPGADPELLLSLLQEHSLRPAAIALTHGHADHISALSALLEAFPCPVYLHPEDAAWCFTSANAFPPYMPPSEKPKTLLPASDFAALSLPELTLSVLSTPGHTPGCVCYRITTPLDPIGALFTGDTLFAGSIGRTDFPGGDMRKMGESLRLLSALPKTLTIFPGHGPSSTIGHEIETNPFLA